MKFIDLYSGIGGFRYALESQGHECVFSAEIDKYAIETYRNNFNDNAYFDMDDLQKMSDEEVDRIIPDHKILTGGFPCQSFSVGGKKKGFNTEDTKGVQFFNILRILEVKKPTYILLENVKHILKIDDGKTYEQIISLLKERGYEVPEKPITLSPHELGIPQKRERTFFVAKLNSKLHNFDKNSIKYKKVNIINKNEDNKELLLSKYEEKVLKGWQEFVNKVNWPETTKIPDLWIDEMVEQQKPQKGDKPWKVTYLTKMNQFYLDNKEFIDKWIKKYDVMNWERREKKFEWRSGDGSDRTFKNKIIVFRTSGVRVKRNDNFPTLVAMVQTPIIFDEHINRYRRLSVIEASRLQSFPKKFIPHRNDKQAYKQFGNAVNVEVIKLIANHYIK